jgi:hypothetical protein
MRFDRYPETCTCCHGQLGDEARWVRVDGNMLPFCSAMCMSVYGLFDNEMSMA